MKRLALWLVLLALALSAIMVPTSGRSSVGIERSVPCIVRRSETEAVEVYRGASEIPPQYRNSSSACGVILTWTQR